ncbi:MAG: DUF2336 domain-containing protein [Kiloniellales bacterium]|nr:DUF2336 domain-containing protein [Kiloniellales bacterium]
MAQAQEVPTDASAGRLSQADVTRLTEDPSTEARAEMAAKLAAEFDGQQLGATERQIAEDIFRSLVKDAEVRVRQALSEHLKASPQIPEDVALALASDVDSVALPVLQYCEVLTDEDLIGIIQAGSPEKQTAVAQRSAVSAGVADALIETGNDGAVAELVGNDGANLDQGQLQRVVKQYTESAAVSQNLATRDNLPPVVSEQLVSVITQQIQSFLMKRQIAPTPLVKKLVDDARGQATLSLLRDGCATNKELEALIDQLYAKGRLTPEVAIDALSEGDLAFFEFAMARLADIGVENARTLINDQGRLGIENLFRTVLHKPEAAAERAEPEAPLSDPLFDLSAVKES